MEDDAGRGISPGLWPGDALTRPEWLLLLVLATNAYLSPVLMAPAGSTEYCDGDWESVNAPAPPAITSSASVDGGAYPGGILV